MASRPSDPRVRHVRPSDPRARPASVPVSFDGRSSSNALPVPFSTRRVDLPQLTGQAHDNRSSDGYLNVNRPQPYYVSPTPPPGPPPGPLPAWWQVVPRRQLKPHEEIARRAALVPRPWPSPNQPEMVQAHFFANLPVEIALRVAYHALRWTGDPDYEVGTVSSIFDTTWHAKQFSLVNSAWREVAEKALYETVHFNLPSANPNVSAFTAWLSEVSWKRERFRHLKTLVVHHGQLEKCPLVSKFPPLRKPIDWSRETHLPTKPGQLLKEMRGYRGTLRHLILDTEGDTFLLPIGLENLNWDELTTATYAARRFSHTGVTQNGGRKPPFPFRLLTEARIYTRELDEHVLYEVYLYLEEFGHRLKTLHFHYERQAHPDPRKRVVLTLSDIMRLCPNLEELNTEPPDTQLCGADIDLWQLKKLVIGSPMVGGQLVERTGQNWHKAAWTTQRLATIDKRLEREKEAEREREAARVEERRRALLKASDVAAWE